MAGIWYRAGTVAVTAGAKLVTGYGSKWRTATIRPDKGHTLWGPDGKAYEIDYVESDTVLYLVTAYAGATASGQAYAIDITRTSTIPAFSRELSAQLAYAQGQYDSWQSLLTGKGDVTLTAPDGSTLTVPSWDKVTGGAGSEADKAKAEADRAAAIAASLNPETGSGQMMRVGGPAILDAERRAVERASGGRQTVLYDAAGAANVMFALPQFSYADLGMTADMGSGVATAFDLGSGSAKSEIFIGAYPASGNGAVSAPRQDPKASITHTAARAACSAKGAGWHMMTMHEWAAVALWCMANGFEPIGNTNYGRSHAKTWLTAARSDGLAPGDASGTAHTKTGALGPLANHDAGPHGIADLVGNVWEWQDGMLLQDGRIKISAHNTQDESAWSYQDAWLDATTATGGATVLSHTINNMHGSAGDNANSGNSSSVDWRSMTMTAEYARNQSLRRLLIEPASILPQGRIYARNFGERLPSRGGRWDYGAYAGLAALDLHNSRSVSSTGIGFRPAFAI